jgi:hypothetical protein
MGDLGLNLPALDYPLKVLAACCAVWAVRCASAQWLCSALFFFCVGLNPSFDAWTTFGRLSHAIAVIPRAIAVVIPHTIAVVVSRAIVVVSHAIAVVSVRETRCCQRRSACNLYVVDV